jgi:hypothetical protein
MLVCTKGIMTMLMMDPWITGRRGGVRRKTLVVIIRMKGKEVNEKKQFGPPDVIPTNDRSL